MTDLQEEISDDMTRRRRLAAMLKMTENLPTEDIELLNERFPRLADCALLAILNPDFCFDCDQPNGLCICGSGLAPEMTELLSEMVDICAETCDCNECGPCRTRIKAEGILSRIGGAA